MLPITFVGGVLLKTCKAVNSCRLESFFAYEEMYSNEMVYIVTSAVM